MIKRTLDFIVSFFALILLSPVLIVVSIIIVLTMGRPILFRQERPGLGGRPFTMIKFRTMRDACDKYGKPLPDDKRLTKIGKILRSTSLDELPELWNVLKGEMSIVGPRPLLMEYLNLYTNEQARRHDVRPGITGWAQVNGRNAISWEDKFEMDVWYVDHHSLWLDLKILMLTVRKVIARDGISSSDHVTVEKYRGSKSE